MMNMDINLERHPEFLAASKKLADAQLELERIEKRIAEIHLELATRVSPTLNDRAMSWLSDGDAHGGTEKPGVRAELGRLIDQKAVLSRAVVLQGAAVDRVRFQLSESIVSSLKPAYVKLVERIARAAIELGDLNRQESEFRDELRQKGVVFGAWLSASPFPRVGHSGEEYSWITGTAEILSKIGHSDCDRKL